MVAAKRKTMKSVREDAEKGQPSHRAGRNVNDTAALKTVWFSKSSTVTTQPRNSFPKYMPPRI
jgi:hypothetical protein